MRDAEDVVGACQDQADAERCSQEVGPRLGQCGLEWSPDQTWGIPFIWQQVPGHPSVDLLGVACRWGRDRAGQPHLQRRTSRQKRRHSRKRVTAWCKQQWRSRLQGLVRELTAQVRGSYHDDGVHGNSASRPAFFP
jgi:hypothetical protein